MWYQSGSRQVWRLVEHSCDVSKEDDSQVIICPPVSVEAVTQPGDYAVPAQDRAVLRGVQYHVSVQYGHESRLQQVPDRVQNAWMGHT